MQSSLASLVGFVTMIAVSAQVAAQVPPPAAAPQPVAPAGAQPPPGYPPPGYPPPGYAPGYPPPGYPPPTHPPPAYYPGQPPPGYYQGQPPGYPPGYVPTPVTSPAVPMDPEDPPDGYHTETRARSGLVVAGAVMLGVGYGISAAAAGAGLSGGDEELVPLFVPVIGPFWALDTSDVFRQASDGAEQTGNVFGAIGLILDGIVQATGFTLLIVGLAARKTVIVRDKPESAQPTGAAPDIAIGPRGATARWTF